MSRTRPTAGPIRSRISPARSARGRSIPGRVKSIVVMQYHRTSSALYRGRRHAFRPEGQTVPHSPPHNTQPIHRMSSGIFLAARPSIVRRWTRPSRDRTGEDVAAPLTELAIQKMREMIASGALSPGSRLPPEAELASELGASRNTLREAVRALVTARVLDVSVATARTSPVFGQSSSSPASGRPWS